MIPASRGTGLLFALSEAIVGFLRRNAASLGLLILYAAGAGITVYYGWLEPSPLNYGGREPQSRLVKNEFYPGEPLENVTTRCNLLDKELTYFTSRRIERLDKAQEPYMLDSLLTTIESGCHDAPSARNKAPDIPGVYRICGVAVVPGTWRTNYVPWHTGDFIVLPPLKGTIP